LRECKKEARSQKSGGGRKDKGPRIRRKAREEMRNAKI